jgi:pilus assembly protein CpaF
MAVDGPAVTIKRFQQRARSLDELMDETPRIKVIGDQTFKLATARMMSENMVNVLKACVKGRVNIIVSGPRDAGKTTILNALCQHLNPREQPCAIEHYPELCLPLDRLVRLQPSSPDGRGDCEIDQRLLVRKALSMNPSRLLLGDCTGGEAYDLLTRSSTSETAWMMTMEANSPDDCLMRLEEQMTRGQSNLSSLMARHFIAQAKPVIVQVRRIEDGTRRVTEIAEVQGLNDGKPKSPWLMERLNLEQVKENDILIAKLFHIERAGRDSLGFFKTKFVANDRIPSFVEKLEQEGVAFKMEWIKKQETLESSAL